MEVTRNNFKEALDKVTTVLKDADFVSFDLELTGLGYSLGERTHDLDTPEERLGQIFVLIEFRTVWNHQVMYSSYHQEEKYKKIRKRVKEYGITQIGVSIFRYCKSKNKFSNATFCFFLSGNPEGSYRYDTSSMNFLAQNGFDFNKLFLEGLTFISLTEEVEIREKRKTTLRERDSNVCAPIKLKEPKTKSFVSNAVNKIKKSVESEQPAVFEGRSLNGFLKKVLFSNVAPIFPNSHFEVVSGMMRDIKVTHFASDQEKRNHIDATWEEDLKEQMGFSHVVKAILEANKPMVGHNMTLDLLHFVDKFVAPLPVQLEEFRTIFKANLPIIYDTKIFAKDPPFSSNIPNSSLGNLYEDLTGNYSPPKFECEEGYETYDLNTEGQAHDGGFDAFMTGVCFITMIKMLEGKRWGRSAMMKSKHLEKYSNKINFMGSFDMPYIDMYKPNVIPDRSHIFTVSCPTSWTMSNVRQVFSSLKSYKAVWVSDTRLFVIPLDEEAAKARLLLSGIRAACSPNVRVDFYEQEDAAAKRNGQVNSAIATRHRGADMTRPSSITLKRSSDSKDTVGADEGAPMDADCLDSGRNLKRLKSVGSELLSNMTLESPMNVEKELPNTPLTLGQEKGKEAKVAEASDASQVFSVPEEW